MEANLRCKSSCVCVYWIGDILFRVQSNWCVELLRYNLEKLNLFLIIQYFKNVSYFFEIYACNLKMILLPFSQLFSSQRCKYPEFFPSPNFLKLSSSHSQFSPKWLGNLRARWRLADRNVWLAYCISLKWIISTVLYDY